jgi:hypothetical protein
MNPFLSKQKHKDHVKKKIFISYREKDTAGETGRLVDALYEHFSEDQIFMDIEKIDPGVDFTEAISHSLQSCDVFLAIIGPNWLGSRESGKPSRIFEPNDWVRLEVATALHRNIRVIPVLVDDGAMPQADQIPADLHPLLNKQAYEISNRRWKYDTEQFISFLVHVVGIQSKNEIEHAARETGKKPWFTRYALWILLLFGIIVIGIVLFQKGQMGETSLDKSKTEQTSARDSVLSPQNTSIHPSGNGVDPGLVRPGNITGTWVEQDEGARSTFIIQQSAKQLTVEVHALGQKISTGTGTIDDRQVVLHFDMFGNRVLLKANISPDQQTMKGTYTFELTGDDQPVVLKKEK